MRKDIENKDYAVSILRLVALLLVIGCHILEHLSMQTPWLGPVGNYFSVGVQIFLFLSGYLYGKKTNVSKVSFVLRNEAKILRDYYVHYALFIIPLCLLLKQYTVNRWFVWRILTGACTIGGEAHLWFIPYIMCCYLITPALYDIREWMFTGKYSLLKLLEFITLIELVFITYDSYFVPAWICCYIIGFFAPNIKERYNNLFSYPMYIGLCLISVVANYVKYLLIYRHGYGADFIKKALADCVWQAQALNECYNWSAILLAITISITICGLFKHIVMRKGVKKFLDLCDKWSYDVYLCHMLFVKGMLSTIFLTDSIFLNLFITFILIIANAIVLYYLCRPKEFVLLIRNLVLKKDSVTY